MIKLRSCLALAFLVFPGGTAALAQARQAEAGYQVKAAFIFNFTRFVEWPAETRSRLSSFTICLVGNPFGGVLEATVRGESAGGKPIEVRTLNATDDPRMCQILYISRSENSQAPELLRMLEMAPVLTVGDYPNFIENGGMVQFTETARKIRFSINPEAGQRARLQISSRLLRVADVVHAK